MEGPAGRTRLNKDNNLAAAETAKNPDISQCLSQASVSGEVLHASEEAGDYDNVVARLNDRWRVIVCAAGLQWILQRRTGERHGRARWEARSFCRTSEALNRLSRTYAGAIDPAAAAILAALPERIDRRARL